MAGLSPGPDSDAPTPPKGTEPVLKAPKQTRSQKTLDRISAAALALMEEVGVEGATVAAIVERAGASVGSFYARFPGKEELVRYLQAQVWSEARERWDRELAGESWEGLSMERMVEGVIGLLVRSLRADFQSRKVLGRQRAGDPGALGLERAFHEHLLTTLIPVLMVRKEEIEHPDPELAVRFGYRVMVGAIREFLEMEASGGSRQGRLIEVGVDGPGPGRQGDGFPEDFRFELARLWNGYLNPGLGVVGDEDSGEVDFFDPWG